MNKVTIKTSIESLLKDNELNLQNFDSVYDRGYADGYRKAMEDLMDKLNIKADNERA